MLSNRDDLKRQDNKWGLGIDLDLKGLSCKEGLPRNTKENSQNMSQKVKTWSQLSLTAGQ